MFPRTYRVYASFYSVRTEPNLSPSKPTHERSVDIIAWPGGHANQDATGASPRAISKEGIPSTLETGRISDSGTIIKDHMSRGEYSKDVTDNRPEEAQSTGYQDVIKFITIYNHDVSYRSAISSAQTTKSPYYREREDTEPSRVMQRILSKYRSVHGDHLNDWLKHSTFAPFKYARGEDEGHKLGLILAKRLSKAVRKEFPALGVDGLLKRLRENVLRPCCNRLAS